MLMNRLKKGRAATNNKEYFIPAVYLDIDGLLMNLKLLPAILFFRF